MTNDERRCLARVRVLALIAEAGAGGAVPPAAVERALGPLISAHRGRRRQRARRSAPSSKARSG